MFLEVIVTWKVSLSPIACCCVVVEPNENFVFLRPAFGRGSGGDGKSFDARQKIGVNDVRQRLGGGTGNVQQD